MYTDFGAVKHVSEACCAADFSRVPLRSINVSKLSVCVLSSVGLSRYFSSLDRVSQREAVVSGGTVGSTKRGR